MGRSVSICGVYSGRSTSDKCDGMKLLLALALGGAIGAVGRHALAGLFAGLYLFRQLLA